MLIPLPLVLHQLVSVLSSVESFEDILLDYYEVYPFIDPYGAPNKVLFYLMLCYYDTDFKMILRRNETNGFGDKAVLALQVQCASLTLVEQTTTQCDFTRMQIVARESLSSYLHHFSMARDKVETVGNKYRNDAFLIYFYLVLARTQYGVPFHLVHHLGESTCRWLENFLCGHGTHVHPTGRMPYIQWPHLL